jgi:transposase
MASPKYTFKQFQGEYPDDNACLDKVMEMRYGGTEIECPHCKRQSKFHKIAKRRAYACQHCGDHIYPCVKTIFEKSRTPLNKWFFAMYLMTSTRHGVAARELERQLGVTYKCAWRMAHELRKLMAAADHGGQTGPLSGHVEADETYLGGYQKGGRAKQNKTIVVGIVERDGPIRAGVIPNVKLETLHQAIVQNVAPGARISTDEHTSYRHLKIAGFDHHSVNHRKNEYARGDVHTNSLEGYWSRLQNSIKGTHVHISKRHAWKYVSEFSYRYNMRKTPEVMFDRMILAVSLPRLADD